MPKIQLIISLVLTVTALPVAHARQEGSVAIVVESEISSKGRVIPDPKNVLALASLLRNISVAEELKIDKSQRDEIEALLKKTHGSLTVSFYQMGAKDNPDSSLTNHESFLLENSRAFFKIVDPIQCKRLQQIAYQVESSRIGLGQALQNGFLADHVGVENFQKGGLKVISDFVEAKSANLIMEIETAAREEIFSELSSSQRELGNKIVGKAFIFREDPRMRVYEYHTPSSTGKENSIPDPTSFLAIVSLALNGSVADELKMDGDKREVLYKLHKSLKGPIETASRRLRSEPIKEEIRKQLEDLLDVNGRERLKQLAYQVEVKRVGLTQALISGFLGKGIGLDAKQKRDIEVKSQLVEAKVWIDILKVKNAAREEILKQLSPTQKEKANDLLGAEFSFRDEAFRVFD